MYPELETFLDETFGGIEATTGAIGRVVVEPDYDTQPNPQEKQQLSDGLLQFIREQPPNPAAMASPQGFEVTVPKDRGLLSKYVRRITFHADRLEGPWVEIEPPGSWI